MPKVLKCSSSLSDCLIVQLHARPQVEAQCGEDVKLMCNVSSSQQMDVKVLSWVAFNRTLCEYERNRTEKEFHCETTKLKDDQTLTLKLNNVMPVNTGKYLCKVQSTGGVNSTATMVTIQGMSCPISPMCCHVFKMWSPVLFTYFFLF
uniref:Ig-like domain-containing protein n=1 Tax=Gouania willdenowi TaxID=441366 RepID=A0A8C5EPW9_GOUWI